MWQRVLANDPQLVDDAYRVLAIYNHKWGSSAEFKQWLEGHDDHVFYSSEDPIDLVVGFRHTDDGRWNGIVVGVDGDPWVDALPRAFDKTVAFMREVGTRSLYLHLTSPESPNPFSDALQMAIDYARAQPEVADVSITPVGRAQEYRLTLVEPAN